MIQRSCLDSIEVSQIGVDHYPQGVWAASCDLPSNAWCLSAFLLRFKPVESIEDFFWEWCLQAAQLTQSAFLLVTAPHGFIFIEAAGKCLRIDEQSHDMVILGMI